MDVGSVIAKLSRNHEEFGHLQDVSDFQGADREHIYKDADEHDPMFIYPNVTPKEGDVLFVHVNRLRVVQKQGRGQAGFKVEFRETAVQVREWLNTKEWQFKYRKSQQPLRARLVAACVYDKDIRHYTAVALSHGNKLETYDSLRSANNTNSVSKMNTHATVLVYQWLAKIA